jgi:putative oxidoreductase
MMRSGAFVAARHAGLFLLVARAGMASLFIFSGLEKVFFYEGAVGFAQSFGVPFAEYSMAGAIILELGSAAALLTRRYCRYGAAILAIWMFVLNPWFHRFWAVAPEDWQMMVDSFFHHFVMIGGMMYIMAFGAGENSTISET